MLTDFVRCYADVLYLRTTLQLPPQPLELTPIERRRSPSRRPRIAERTVAWLVKAARFHMAHTGTPAALAGKRSFRGIGD